MATRPVLCLLLFAGLALAPMTAGHSVFEAAELEVHLINDEGSDAIEAYGGYDIQEVFAGFAHYPEVGAGSAGDGFYLRTELYGSREEAVVPQTEAWTIRFIMVIDGTTVERSLSTTDGLTFTHDFDVLDAEVEARDTHINRAFIAYGMAGITPGQTLSSIRVESRAGTDLRDVAPGGIPVPGTNGLQEYDDPTAIEGTGVVTDSLMLGTPENYLFLTLASQPGRIYDVTGQSALTQGGQHAIVEIRDDAGWNYTLSRSTNKPLEANETFTFRIEVWENGAAPLEIDIFTDVGGRTPLSLSTNGTLSGPGGLAATSEPLKASKDSPGLAVPFLAAALLAAVIVRRRD